MLFNSLNFLVFFPVVTLVYFLLPHRFRWFLLLVASIGFYMAFVPLYILVLAVTIVVDYFSGIWMEKSEGRKKKIFLLISLVSTISVLFVFKYFNFFNANFAALANFFDWHYPIEALKIILPIGLSFHTFQGMSYIIEVYRGHQKPEKNFGIYALYVMFYPQLVAGPIERPQNLLHQFYEEHKFDYRRITDGLKLMAWGMFKKVVIADRLAVLVNQVYDQPYSYAGSPLLIATIFFAFQIYCDFSGYSDIARGAAQVMGFNLMRNFDRPYFSKSISEFWKRWHISLSTWFRDYVYIPLGGNRVSVPRWYVNLMLVFLLSGLWHGANWTFVVWGGLHGFYLVFSLLSEKFREKLVNILGLRRFPALHKIWQVLATFCLVLLSWVFFRARSVGEAFYIIRGSITWLGGALSSLGRSNLEYFSESWAQVFRLNFSVYDWAVGLLALTVLLLIHFFQRGGNLREKINNQPTWFRWLLYYGLIITIIIFGYYGTGPQQFIYFQF